MNVAEPIERWTEKDGPTELLLTRMEAKDLDRILEIETLSFSQPYSREIFEEELTLDIAQPWVLRLGDAVVGFIDYWVVKNEIHLINIAVDPKFRRRRFASFLMEEMEKDAERRGAAKIFLDVRESNLPAIYLYEKFGFHKVGLRRRYYSDNNENAVLMAKML